MQNPPFLLVLLTYYIFYTEVMKNIIITLILVQSFVLVGCFEKKEMEPQTLNPVEEAAVEWSTTEDSVANIEEESSSDEEPIEAEEVSEDTETQDTQQEVTPVEREEAGNEVVEPATPDSESTDSGNIEKSTETSTEVKAEAGGEAEIIAEYEEDLEALFDDLLKGGE